MRAGHHRIAVPLAAGPAAGLHRRAAREPSARHDHGRAARVRAGHWWEHLLHNQTALRLKAALLFHPGVVVANVPYHLAARTRRRGASASRRAGREVSREGATPPHLYAACGLPPPPRTDSGVASGPAGSATRRPSGPSRCSAAHRPRAAQVTWRMSRCSTCWRCWPLRWPLAVGLLFLPPSPRFSPSTGSSSIRCTTSRSRTRGVGLAAVFSADRHRHGQLPRASADARGKRSSASARRSCCTTWCGCWENRTSSRACERWRNVCARSLVWTVWRSNAQTHGLSDASRRVTTSFEGPPGRHALRRPWLTRHNATAAAPGRWVRVVRPRRATGARDAAGARAPRTGTCRSAGSGALLLVGAPSPPSTTADRLLSAVAAQLGLAVERARLRRRPTRPRCCAAPTSCDGAAERRLARPADATGVDHGLGGQPAAGRRGVDARGAPGVRAGDRGRGAAAEPDRRQSARPVAHRSRQTAAGQGLVRPRRAGGRSGRRLRPRPPAIACHACAGRLPAVSLDYVEIDQVLSNLVENAPGTPRPARRFPCRPAGQWRSARGRRGPGPGVPPSSVPHLFDPFYRVADGAPGRRPRPGAGRGEGAGRGARRPHLGENRPGGGARFTFPCRLAKPWKVLSREPGTARGSWSSTTSRRSSAPWRRTCATISGRAGRDRSEASRPIPPPARPGPARPRVAGPRRPGGHPRDPRAGPARRSWCSPRAAPRATRSPRSILAPTTT